MEDAWNQRTHGFILTLLGVASRLGHRPVFWAAIPFVSISGAEHTGAGMASPIGRQCRDELALSPRVVCSRPCDLGLDLPIPS